MGEEDLRFDTPEHLAADVAKIKRDYERYRTISDLQFEFMEEFEELKEGQLFRVTYSDGSVLLFNLGTTECEVDGKLCPPCSMIRL